MSDLKKEYPSSFGKRWSTIEEKQLLKEIFQDIDIEEISSIHGRSLGGISSRLEVIAYKMHMDGKSLDKISSKTKLEKDQISEIIEKKSRVPVKKSDASNSELNTSVQTLNTSVQTLNDNIEKLIKIFGGKKSEDIEDIISSLSDDE